MPLDQSIIDVLRATHLTFFAAGMGTALYFDFRTFITLGAPITRLDIDAFERIHAWITMSFVSLWMTGLCLVYVRTGFDIAAFSPKLWLKLSLMTLMVLNARLIAIFVLPLLKQAIGRSMISLPERDLTFATQITVVSVFCWTSGMVLRSSVVLKTAGWEVLLPLTVAWFCVLTVVGQLALIVRRRLETAKDQDALQLKMSFD